MKHRYLALTVLAFAQAGPAVISSGLGALAPFLVSSLQLSGTQIGILSATIGVAWILVSSGAGVLVDRYDEQRVIILSGIGMALTLLAATIIANFFWLLLWLGLFGIISAFAAPAGGRAILLWFTRDRGMAMSVRLAGVPLGGFIAALMLPPISAHFGYRAGLIAAGLFIIVTSTAVVLLRGPATRTGAARGRLRHLWNEMRSYARDPRSILLSVAQIDHNVAQTCATAFLSLSLLSTAHVPVIDAVLALAAMQFGSIAGRAFWGIFSDRALHGERLLPVAAASIIGAGAALFFALDATVSPLFMAGVFACAFALGFSIAGCNGLFAALQTEVAGPELAGSALGIVSGRTSLATACAPPTFGFVADHWGYSVAWSILSGVTLLGIIPALHARHVIAAHGAKAA